MITIKQHTKSEYSVKFFSQDNFHEILDLCKETGLKYNPDDKSWSATAIDIHTSHKEFELIEETKYIPSRDKVLNDCKPVLEVKRQRFKIDADLFKYPPMLGKAPYENFQLDSIKRGCSTNRHAFYIGMGGGKSYILVNIKNQLMNKNKVGAVVIVCVPEVLHNWKHEILKFNSIGITEDDIYIADKNNRTPFETDKKIIIMTYRTMITISDTYNKLDNKKPSKNYRKVNIRLSQWFSDKKKMLILDESHKVKNIKSKSYKLINLQKHFFEHRYLLSGTPAPQGACDYYAQIKILDDNLIGMSYLKWLGTIASLGNRFSRYGINYYYEDKVDKFLDSISSHVTRLREQDILDLPELTRKVNYCRLEGKQQKIYQLLSQQELGIIKEEHGKLESKLVEQKFPYISLALHNPSILKGKIDKDKSPELFKLVDKWKFKDHNKLEVFDSLVEKYVEAGHRILIWSSHPVTIDELSEHYSKHKPYSIHGETDTKGVEKSLYKQKLLEDFKKDKDSKLLILSSLSMSTGITVNECTITLIFDRTWGYVDFGQLLKRNHRLGQTEKVTAHIPLFEDSLEIKQHNDLLAKEGRNQKDFIPETNDVLGIKEVKDLLTGVTIETIDT